MIKLMKSTFYKEEETKQKLCEFILKANKLSMGEKCREFEIAFSKYQGRRFAVLVNSGSSANLALIYSLLKLGKINPGDNVGVSALTWSTNVSPLLQLGLNPVPIDVSLNTLNVSSGNLLETLKTKELKALFITNALGFCGDLDKIVKICEEKNIILLEDNCESLGSVAYGKKLGNFGLSSTFSSFVGHHLSTIEGGLICTDDEKLYEMLVMVRSHGWSRDLPKESAQRLSLLNNIDDFSSKYSFFVPGFNLRPTEITGFIGLEQLNFLNEMNSLRKLNFERFSASTKDNPAIHGLDSKHMDFVSNFAYPLVFKDLQSFEKIKKLFEDSVEIRPIISGSVTKQPFFKDYMAKNGLSYSCPNSEFVHKNGFY